MWFWLWTGLIAAWLVGVFFGLRWLWRQVKALMEAASAAADKAGTAADSANSAFEPAPVPEVAVFAKPEDLMERVQARWDRKAARRRRRQERHQAAYDAWAVLAGYRDAGPDGIGRLAGELGLAGSPGRPNRQDRPAGKACASAYLGGAN